jgi:hypothetical protein
VFNSCGYTHDVVAIDVLLVMPDRLETARDRAQVSDAMGALFRHHLGRRRRRRRPTGARPGRRITAKEFVASFGEKHRLEPRPEQGRDWAQAAAEMLAKMKSRAYISTSHRGDLRRLQPR